MGVNIYNSNRGRSLARRRVFNKPAPESCHPRNTIIGWAAFGISTQERRPLVVSVMIVTQNRLADLQRTCWVLKSLDPVPDDILIAADGCTDGTVAFVNLALPSAK